MNRLDLLTHWPKGIFVCPKCGTIVSWRGWEPPTCGMHFPEEVEGELVKVVPLDQLRGAVSLLERGIELVSYARYTAADAAAEEWIAEARVLVDSGGQS